MRLDLLNDGDEEKDGSQDWLQLIDRGGLTHVNNNTFEMFVVRITPAHPSRTNAKFRTRDHFKF